MQQPEENFNYENNKNNINENEENKIEEQKPKKTFFTTHKEYCESFFKTTRVNSGSHVLVKKFVV